MFQDADYTVRRAADFDYDTAIAELEEQVRAMNAQGQLAPEQEFEVDDDDDFDLRLDSDDDEGDL